MATPGDDPSFEEMMDDMGVTPLPGGAPAPEPPAGPLSEALSEPLAEPLAEPPAAPQPLGPTPAEWEALLAENQRLTEALRTTESRADQSESQRDAATAQVEAFAAASRQAEQRARGLGAELAEARRLIDQRIGLRRVMTERGLVDERECVEALAGLLLTRARELLDALELSSSERVATLLARRLALVDAAVAAEIGADKDCVAIIVPANRCEVTGGSDIRAAYHDLVEACRRAGVARITIVGGSPAYRTQLQGLAEPHRQTLRLNLVSGTKRRVKHRIEADVRSSDLIVLWGATLLDHSVSGGYTGTDTPTVTVPHRGISGMLARLAEAVSGLGGVA